MKEIGQRLKETREAMGISIEEAANDLKLKPSQIENIEEGNMEAFKDIFYLKYFIRDYSKYLGLSYEDMVDEFNEYLFDYTSKISIDDIKKARKKDIDQKEDLEKRIASPYTIEHKKKEFPIVSVILICISLVIFVLGIYLFLERDTKEKVPDNTIAQANLIR